MPSPTLVNGVVDLPMRQCLLQKTTYARIRDHPNGEPYRQQLEQMWLDYKEYAPKGFPRKLQFEFHQRWWEMYLTIGLSRLGLPVSTFRQDKGPDLLVTYDDTKVWIEAVAPKSGTTSDAVPQPLVNGVVDLPMRECLLRLTQAVTAKLDKFTNYIQQGLVSEADCCIVAVSACGLNLFGTLLDFPQPVMLRVLAGAGDLAIPLDGNGSYSKGKISTFRDSGSQVDVALFYSKKFSLMAGVLYSNQDPLNAPPTPEESLEFFSNPKAKVIVPAAIREAVATWSENSSIGQEVEWKRTQPEGPPDRNSAALRSGR